VCLMECTSSIACWVGLQGQRLIDGQHLHGSTQSVTATVASTHFPAERIPLVTFASHSRGRQRRCTPCPAKQCSTPWHGLLGPSITRPREHAHHSRTPAVSPS
jgi:hypothetical protein